MLYNPYIESEVITVNKLTYDFVEAIVNEYKQKRFIDTKFDEEFQKFKTELARESAYVFALCINKLIDDGYFK